VPAPVFMTGTRPERMLLRVCTPVVMLITKGAETTGITAPTWLPVIPEAVYWNTDCWLPKPRILTFRFNF